MAEKTPKGVDQSFRRTWDLQAAEKRAKEREARDLSIAEQTKQKVKSLKDMQPVQAREEELRLDIYVGRTIQITSNTPESKQGGFYCEICECQMKDSQNYLDHINGKKHQRMLGSSLRSERATLDQVRERLKKVKDKTTVTTSHEDYEERMRRLREKEERRKQEEKEKKKELIKQRKEEKKGQEVENEEDEILKSMGLPANFGTTGGKK